jgi:hypothetical protein
MDGFRTMMRAGFAIPPLPGSAPPRTRRNRYASRRLWLAIALTLGVAGAAWLRGHNPTSVNYLPHCVFHDLTGLHCPGCGATRAFYSLAHGQVLLALHCNPLLVLLLPLLAWWGVQWAIAAVRDNRAPAPMGHAWRGRTVWALVLVICAFWVLRNIPIYPFTLLAPPASL